MMGNVDLIDFKRQLIEQQQSGQQLLSVGNPFSAAISYFDFRLAFQCANHKERTPLLVL